MNEPLIDDMAPVWRALADPHRRRILDLLRESPRTTGWLAERFEFSRFGLMKHLRVLEEANLVVVERRGRERFNHLNPAPIQAIQRRWMRPFEANAADRLLRLKELVERQEEEKEDSWPSAPPKSPTSSSKPGSKRRRRKSGKR